MKMILIDDELDILEIMDDVIKEEFHEADILSFSGGQEFVNYLKDNLEDFLQVDMVISDYNMPCLNGIEVKKMIDYVGWKNQFILFTGRSIDLKKTYQQHFNDLTIIEKPDFNLLLKNVKEYIDSSD